MANEQLEQQEQVQENPGSGQGVAASYIRSTYIRYISERDEALADLSVYLNSPTAVGDHGNIGAEIRKKCAEVAASDKVVDTLQKYFGNVLNPQQQETASESEASDPPETT